MSLWQEAPEVLSDRLVLADVGAGGGDDGLAPVEGEPRPRVTLAALRVHSAVAHL